MQSSTDPRTISVHRDYDGAAVFVITDTDHHLRVDGEPLDIDRQPVAEQQHVDDLDTLIAVINDHLPEGRSVRVGLDPVPGDDGILSLVCEGFRVDSDGDFVSTFTPAERYRVEVRGSGVEVPDFDVDGYVLGEWIMRNSMAELTEHVGAADVDDVLDEVIVDDVEGSTSVFVTLSVDLSLTLTVTLDQIGLDPAEAEHYEDEDEWLDVVSASVVTYLASDVLFCGESDLTVDDVTPLPTF